MRTYRHIENCCSVAMMRYEISCNWRSLFVGTHSPQCPPQVPFTVWRSCKHTHGRRVL